MKYKFLKSDMPYVEREVYVECDCSCSVLKFIAFGNTDAEHNMIFVSVLGPCQYQKSLTVRCSKDDFKTFVHLFKAIYELNRPGSSQAIVIDDNILDIVKDKSDAMHIICYPDKERQSMNRSAWDIEIEAKRVRKVLKHLTKLLKYIEKSGSKVIITTGR